MRPLVVSRSEDKKCVLVHAALNFQLLVVSCAALVSARPEAGYSYNPPSAVPSGSYGAPGLVLAGGGGGGALLGSLSGGGFSGAQLTSGLGGGAGLSGLHFGGSSAGLSLGSGGFSSGGFSSGGGNFISSGGSVVQKHIYVHVPPPEPEEFRPQRPIHVPAAQKHYKIIFIKAPTPPTPTVPTIPLQPQNEEKTLVYVLVKKPDEAPEITIPTALPTQPSKPEVYFIRYRTNKDVVATGAGGGGAIGGGVALGGATLSGISGGASLTSISSAGLDAASLGGLSAPGAIASGPIGTAGTVAIGGSHLSAGSSSAGLSTNYGPPGKSGPY